MYLVIQLALTVQPLTCQIIPSPCSGSDRLPPLRTVRDKLHSHAAACPAHREAEGSTLPQQIPKAGENAEEATQELWLSPQAEWPQVSN